MKIVFCCAEDETPGVCYLSAFLKKHHHQIDLVFDPKQFDRAYIRSSRLANFFRREREKDNLEKIAKIKPDLIGFSCTTAHYQWALGFARKVKRKFPEVPIIFGGVHPTLVPELVIKESCIDFVCVGEGEEPLAELLQAIEEEKKDFKIDNIWYKKGKKIYRNPLRHLNQNLDSLPFVDKELFRGYLPRHYFTHSYFFTGRGCPFSCSYCGNERMKKIFQRKGIWVRRLSPKRAVEELVFIKKNYGAQYILFEDDIFALDISWLKKFIPLYKKKVNLPFTCFGHTHSFTPEIARLLKNSGCNLLWFGMSQGWDKIYD